GIGSGLKTDLHMSAGPGRSKLRGLMLGTQVAICVVLLISAGLLVRASWRAFQVNVGYRERGLVALSMDYGSLAPAAVAQRRRELRGSLVQQPGIQSVAIADSAPLVWGLKSINIAPVGRATVDTNSAQASFNRVTPNYFDTVGIPIVRGRTFVAEELRDDVNFDRSPIIVSDTTARH